MAISGTQVSIVLSTNVAYGTSGSLGTASLNNRIVTTYETGTSDSQADTVYAASVTVTNPTAYTTDFRGGTILQPDGSTASFVELTTLEIVYKSGTGVLTIGGGSNPIVGVAGTLEKAGDTFLLHKPTSGITVTAGTGDILTLSSSSGVIVADVFAIGRSA